jgi:hypothetical protein
MYVCMYVNIFTDVRIHCRAGPAVLYFTALASMTAKQLTEARSFKALIGQGAEIRIHCRAGPATVVHSHCCTGSVAVCRGHCRADPAVEVRSNGRVPF